MNSNPFSGQTKQPTSQQTAYSGGGQNALSSIFETGGIATPGGQDAGLTDLSAALAQLPQQASPAMFGDNSPFGDFGPDAFDQFTNPEAAKEKQKLDQMRMKRHMEIHSSPVYDAEAERNKQAIKHILEELEKLSGDLSDTYEAAKDAKNVAINQTISVGTGSLNFLEKLMKTIQMLRIQVKQSRAWLKAMNNKQSKKLGFWGHVKNNNMQWAMSQERAVEQN